MALVKNVEAVSRLGGEVSPSVSNVFPECSGSRWRYATENMHSVTEHT